MLLLGGQEPVQGGLADRGGLRERLQGLLLQSGAGEVQGVRRPVGGDLRRGEGLVGRPWGRLQLDGLLLLVVLLPSRLGVGLGAVEGQVERLEGKRGNGKKESNLGNILKYYIWKEIIYVLLLNFCNIFSKLILNILQ